MTETRKTHAEMTAETRARLIASARASFGKHGFAATSMDALCLDAGVTRGALYHHFGSKTALLDAVVEELDKEIGAHLDTHYDTIKDPFDALCACLVEYLRLALNPEIQQILLRDAPAVLGQRMREIETSNSITPLKEALEELLADRRIVPCDPETVARMLNGALIDAALWIAAADAPQARFDTCSDSILLFMKGLDSSRAR